MSYRRSITSLPAAAAPAFAFLAFAFLAVALPGVALADDDRTHLVADEVGYDEEFGLFVARGHVEMQRDDKIVMSDVLTYNERTKTLTASGNVAILLPSGDTIFGSYADVTEDMNDGLIRDFRALLADQSRLAASSAQRVNGTTLSLTNAVYTPCLPCREDPSRQPIWQVRADSAVQDDIAQTVTYDNARLEMFGLPVFWTPYFRHPAPGVKRASGLLEPRYSFSSGDAGYQVAVPYFITLGTDKDITLTPILRVGGNPDPAAGVGLVEYRQRFRDGAIKLEGSGTMEDRKGDDDRDIEKNNDFRGHVAADGLFEINRDWRWGGNLKAATDKTYLRQYHLGSPSWVENQLWAEGYFGRSYFEARALGFQSTKRKRDRPFRARGNMYDDENAPIVLPAMRYAFLSEPDSYGSYLGLELGTANIMRQDGREYFRLSAKPSWTLPYTSSIGDIYELHLSLQSDLYVVNGVDTESDLVDPNGANEFNGTVGRVFPQASLKWRYPFVRPGQSITQVFQPIAQLVMSPDIGNSGKIPNEDTADFSWDTTRLFEPDRFSGNDRVDNGSRVNYGLQWLGYFEGGGTAEVMVGQSLRFLGDSTSNFNDSGIEDDLSNLIGRLSATPTDWLHASYEFELDVDNGNMEWQTGTVALGDRNLRGVVSYTSSDKEDPWNDDEQIYAGLSSEYFTNWEFKIGAAYSLERNDIISVQSGIEYQDECFGATLAVSYVTDDAREDDDLSGDFTAFVQFRFTNLGSIGAGG